MRWTLFYPQQPQIAVANPNSKRQFPSLYQNKKKKRKKRKKERKRGSFLLVWACQYRCSARGGHRAWAHADKNMAPFIFFLAFAALLRLALAQLLRGSYPLSSAIILRVFALLPSYIWSPPSLRGPLSFPSSIRFFIFFRDCSLQRVVVVIAEKGF